MSNWRTIETAPAREIIILWADTSFEGVKNWRMGSGYFCEVRNAWIWEGEVVREWAFPPTHWHPLPEPPEVSNVPA